MAKTVKKAFGRRAVVKALIKRIIENPESSTSQVLAACKMVVILGGGIEARAMERVGEANVDGIADLLGVSKKNGQ